MQRDAAGLQAAVIQYVGRGTGRIRDGEIGSCLTLCLISLCLKQAICTSGLLRLAQLSHFGLPHSLQVPFVFISVLQKSHIRSSNHFTPNIPNNIVIHNNNNKHIPPIENLYAQIMLLDFRLFNW